VVAAGDARWLQQRAELLASTCICFVGAMAMYMSLPRDRKCAGFWTNYSQEWTWLSGVSV
jgi:hypothetical protein